MSKLKCPAKEGEQCPRCGQSPLGICQADYMDSEICQHLEGKIAAFEAERQWISVEDRLPDNGELVVVWIPETTAEEGGPSFDFIEDEYWQHHADSYEHYMAVGGSAAAGPDNICTGPSEYAPYTHWLPLPNQPEGE